MTSLPNARASLMLAHGGLTLAVGLAFLYLRATMTNQFFEFFATILAVLLAIASLLIAAATEWMAAYLCEINHLHKGMFFLLSGGLFAAAALSVAYFNGDSMRLLSLFATLHAFAFGCWTLFFARSVWRGMIHTFESILLGLASLGFAAGFFWTRPTDGRRAVTLLGVYTCFVGFKLIYHALRIRSASQERRLPGQQFGSDGVDRATTT